MEGRGEQRFCPEGKAFKQTLIHKPGNHLFLFIGRMPPAAQDLGRSGQEVQTVVLEVLIDQRQENLEETTQSMKQN